MNDDKISEVWDFLIDSGVAEQTLQVATSLAGYTLETLESVLFIITGCRSLGQLTGEDEE